MSRVRDLMKSSKGRHFPGTSVKFRKSKSGPRVSSLKNPKFNVGARLKLK